MFITETQGFCKPRLANLPALKTIKTDYLIIININGDNYGKKNQNEEDDEKDFHVKTVADETLITPNGGLDDEEEFVCDMHNFGDSDDLPVSDRAMMTSRQRCDYP